MLIELMEDHRVDVSESLFVGDGFSDEEAAKAVGMDFIWAHDFFMWPLDEVVESNFGRSLSKEFLDRMRAKLSVESVKNVDIQ
jgi:FMN phosphatase YigB (HAD superfamily)